MRPNPTWAMTLIARSPDLQSLLRTLRYHLLQMYICPFLGQLLILLLLLRGVDVGQHTLCTAVIFDPTQLPDLTPLAPET